MLAVLLPAGAAAPTTDLPPAPSAQVPVAVRYPPVPIAGTAWESTVAKRVAAQARRPAQNPKQPNGRRHPQKKQHPP